MNNGNGDSKANDAVMELCEVIEATFNPLRILNGGNDGFTVDCVDLYHHVEEKFTRAFNPTYEELGEQLEQAGGLSNVLLDMRIIERDAWFAAACLFGMKLAGKPMEEIKQSAIAMLARERKIRSNLKGQSA